MSEIKFKEQIDTYLKYKPSTFSLAIFTRANDLIYNTKNWNIEDYIEKISTAWDSGDIDSFIISGIKYIILQKTPEGLISIDPREKKYILGYRNEDMKIICSFSEEKNLKSNRYLNPAYELVELAKILNKLSSKKPYINHEKQLGRSGQVKWATPKLLLNSAENLKQLGLLKVGLSYEEAQVYLSLLKRGEAGEKVGNLNKELDIKRTTIYRIINRLIDNNWVEKISETPRGVNLYAAKPFNSQFEEIIIEKEKELQVLKSMKYIIEESLENGWLKLSELESKDQKFEEELYSYKTLSIIGMENDCGVIIFDYDKKVNEDVVIKAALQLFNEKIMLEIGKQSNPNLEHTEDFKNVPLYKIVKRENPDLEDIKIEDKTFHTYKGTILYLKFKEGSEIAKNIGNGWISTVNQVAIPVDDKIYVIWGTDEKFPILMSIALKIN